MHKNAKKQKKAPQKGAKSKGYTAHAKKYSDLKDNKVYHSLYTNERRVLFTYFHITPYQKNARGSEQKLQALETIIPRAQKSFRERP